MKLKRALLLAATVVLVLCGMCGVWLHKERQQYARNRQLIDALIHDDANRALTLVNAGADPNTPYASLDAPSLKLLLDTLLHRNNSAANNTVTAFMLAYGITWEPTTGKHLVPIILTEDLPLLREMLAHGANIHVQTSMKETMLHYAASEDRLHTAELLLSHGADINAQDGWGHTPLMLTTGNETLDLQRLLLAKGANPNVQDKVGETALYWAVATPDTERSISLLLAYRADPGLRTGNGLTPLTLAQKNKRPDLARLLKGGAGR